MDAVVIAVMETTSESDALGTLILAQTLNRLLSQTVNHSTDASYEVMIDALLVAIEYLRQNDRY